MDLGAALTTDISAEPIISGALLGGALAAGGAYVAAALGIGGTGAAAAGGAATVVNGAVQAAGADGDPTNEIQHGMQILERAANNANIRPQFRLGAQAQLDRATHWLSTGRLTNVEQRIANGRLDLALTNGQAVEVKYWTNTYALQSIETLGGQLLRYQNAGYNMILEMLTTKTDPITSETWARIASYLHSMGVQLAEGSGIVP